MVPFYHFLGNKKYPVICILPLYIYRHRHRHRDDENDNDGRAVGSGWCKGRPGKHSNNTHDDDDDDDTDDDDDDEFQCIIGLPR